MRNLRLFVFLYCIFSSPLILLAQPIKSNLKETITPVKPDLIIEQLEDSEYFLYKTITEESFFGPWQIIDSFEYFYDEEKRLIEKQWWNYYYYPEDGKETYRYSYRFPDSLIIIKEEGLFDEWKNVKKTWHFYDDNRNRTKTDITFYDHGFVTDFELYRYLYNETGQIIADTFFVNSGLGIELRALNTYLYNESGQLIQETNASYYYFDTSFERSIYEYDANNNLIRRLDYTADSINAVVWEQNYTFLLEYDDQNRLITYLEFGENWEDPNYIDSIRITYEYPSPYLTIIISQDLSTFPLANDLRLQIRYNEEGQNTSNFLEVWQDSIWREFLFDTTTYNQAGLIEFYLLRGKPETEWIDLERTKYFYNQLTSLPESPIPQFDFNIFPNPSNDQFTIDWPNSGMEEGMILVYDLYGRLIHNEKTGPTKQTTFYLSDFPNGTYLVRISDGKQWGIQRIQLLK